VDIIGIQCIFKADKLTAAFQDATFPDLPQFFTRVLQQETGTKLSFGHP
jgi:hypothetical protein